MPRALLGLVFLLSLTASAQSNSSSSSSSTVSQDNKPRPAATSSSQDENPTARPRVAQVERGGAAVTLETSEPLFQMAVALNACGYDDDLDRSAPVRQKIREELNQALQSSEAARTSRDTLCTYIDKHRLSDQGLNIAQYVSLSLYLSAPPELTPNVDETDLPPSAAAVVNVLTPLRVFASDANLHFLWLRHRADYEAFTARVHDPMTQMILATNIYLHQPVSTYDGRRFLVLLEPMLSPSQINARIYGTDYITVVAPDSTPATDADGRPGDPVRMDEIRHIYLHYIAEPFVYSHSSALERLEPLLRSVQDAPIDPVSKSDVQPLLTECLVKAIEARMLEFPEKKPRKPSGVRTRAELDLYDQELAVYNKETAIARDRLIETDMKQGWVLTRYFANELVRMEHAGDGLRDEIGQMIYGMDVDSVSHAARNVVFVKDVPPDPLRPARRHRVLSSMDKAELALIKGDLATADDLAEKELARPDGDHAQAEYIQARINLISNLPEDAEQGFLQAIKDSKDPRTLAWSHIYLGRLYDTANPPERSKAITEYKAALTVRDARPDTRIAADAGLKQPYQLPKRTTTVQKQTSDGDKDDKDDFDPTGKAQKDAYQPKN